MGKWYIPYYGYCMIYIILFGRVVADVVVVVVVVIVGVIVVVVVVVVVVVAVVVVVVVGGGGGGGRGIITISCGVILNVTQRTATHYT